jgi:hypothetical protein
MPRVSTVRLLTGLSMMCAAGLAVLVDVGRGADLDKVIMVTVMSVVAAGGPISSM